MICAENLRDLILLPLVVVAVGCGGRDPRQGQAVLPAPDAPSNADQSSAQEELAQVESAWQADLEAGKLDEAVAHAEQKAELQRQLVRSAGLDRPADTREANRWRLELAETLEWLAEYYEQYENFPQAVAARRAALATTTEVYGADDWHVTDARLAVEHAERLSQLTAGERQELAEAAQLFDDAEACYGKSIDEAIIKFEGSRNKRAAVLGEGHHQTAECDGWLASAYKNRGDYATAQPLYERSLATYRRVFGENHPKTATGLNNFGLMHRDLGDYSQARQLLEEAWKIRERVLGRDHRSTAASLNNLAALGVSTGNYDEAQPLLEKALKIKQEVLGRDDPSTAASLNNLALLYTWTGKYSEAMKNHERALEIYRKVPGDTVSPARSLHNLALLHEMTGDYSKAESLFKRSLDIYRSARGEEHIDTAQIRGNLGLLYTAMKDFDEAERLYDQALNTFDKVLGKEHPRTVQVRTNLALLYAVEGDAEEDGTQAALYYEKALDQYRALLGADPISMAQTLDVDRLGEQHFSRAASFHNLAALYESMGDDANAELLYQRALEIRTRFLGDQHIETAASLNSLGLLMLSRGRQREAATLIGQSLATRRRLLDDTATVQVERQQLLMNQNLRGALDDWLSAVADESAYAEVLRWKGAVFVRQATLRAVRQQPELNELVEQLRAVSSRLAKFASTAPAGIQQPDRLQDIIDQRDQVEAELTRRSQEYRETFQLAELTPEELTSVLRENTALIDLLEYDRFVPPPIGEPKKARRERRFVAFVVRPDRALRRIELGSAETIDALVENWHRVARDTSNSPLTAPARELRRVVWEPLEEHLDGVDTVLISPDGSLGKLPFAALPGRKAETYLVEDLAVALIPVPQTLLTLLGPTEEGEPAEPSLLVVGGIDYGQRTEEINSSDRDGEASYPPTAPLPASRGEAAAIRNYFERAEKKGEATFLQDEEPTEEEIRNLAPQFQFLHFATHGFFMPERYQSALDKRHELGGRGGSAVERGFLGYPPGLQSGLVFAGAGNRPGDDGNDGILHSLEIAEMDLSHVKLAVLSACETGVGPVAGGEGLLGVQRSFQLAGARTVVATLWKVNDAATGDLMQPFYESYWAKNKSERKPLIECLRQAQLGILNGDKWRGERLGRERTTVKNPRSAPVFWAAFVLSGDWR